MFPFHSLFLFSSFCATQIWFWPPPTCSYYVASAAALPHLGHQGVLQRFDIYLLLILCFLSPGDILPSQLLFCYISACHWLSFKVKSKSHLHLRTLKITATVHNECLVKIGKTLNLWVEGKNRKRLQINGNMLYQKALSLCEKLKQGIPWNEGCQVICCK